MAPARVAGVGGPSQFSSASGVFIQADGQSPATRNSIFVNGQSGLGTSSREMNSGTNSSGPSIGASSLVTDDNSVLSGQPRLQRSTSIDNESCVWLPASPMSFSSINISGSSMMDGSSLMQQGQHQQQEQLLVQGASSAPLKFAVAQEPDIPSHAPKKLRLDMGQQGNILHMLQRQEALQMQGHQNPQLSVITQQQRQFQWPQQQHILQSLPQMQHVQLHPQLQQPRHSQLQQQSMRVVLPIRYDSERDLCAQRLLQYMYHQRHRLPDNSIVYWKKFVAEYFAPQAKKRWCFALCGNGGNHASAAFPQASVDSWQCGICGSKSGKGFEATFEVLPRLYQIKFDGGVINEILFIDMPHEFRLPTGMMVLEYANAVQESVYEQAHVIHEGQLRIIFAPDLKILSWDFCARRHEVFVPHRLIAPQVNQLLQAAPNFEAAVNESGSTGISLQDTKTNWNMYVYTCRQLAKSLDIQSLNDLGLPKRYMRCVQIAEAVNSMKDLIDISHKHKIGPIESLKNYPQHAAAKHQTSKTLQVDQLMTSLGQQHDQNILNKSKGEHLGFSLRTSANPNHNALQADTLGTFGGPNQAESMPSQSHVPSTLVSPSVNGSLNHQQQQSPQLHNSSVQSSQSNEQLKEHIITQLLRELKNNNNGAPQQTFSAPNLNGNVAAEAFGSGISGAGGLSTRFSAGPARNGVSLGNNMNYASNNVAGMIDRNNSFKSIANNTANVSSISINPGQVMPQNVCPPELDQDIPSQDFVNNVMLNGEPRGQGSSMQDLKITT